MGAGSCGYCGFVHVKSCQHSSVFHFAFSWRARWLWTLWIMGFKFVQTVHDYFGLSWRLAGNSSIKRGQYGQSKLSTPISTPLSVKLHYHKIYNLAIYVLIIIHIVHKALKPLFYRGLYPPIVDNLTLLNLSAFLSAISTKQSTNYLFCTFTFWCIITLL